MRVESTTQNHKAAMHQWQGRLESREATNQPNSGRKTAAVPQCAFPHPTVFSFSHSRISLYFTKILTCAAAATCTRFIWRFLPSCPSLSSLHKWEPSPFPLVQPREVAVLRKKDTCNNENSKLVESNEEGKIFKLRRQRWPFSPPLLYAQYVPVA